MSRKGESIYKRKDGRWEARFKKEDFETGQKVWVSVYAKSYTEVKNKRIKAIKQLAAENLSCSQGSLIVSDLMWRWLDVHKWEITASSYQKYEGIIRNHIQPRIGRIRVAQLSKLTLQQFRNSLLKNGSAKQKGGLSVRSVNTILTVLNAALKWTSEWTNVPLLKIPFLRESRFSLQILSKTDQVLLEKFTHTNQNVYTFGILLALYTGMRLGEVCALQWQDINKEMIFVHRTMQRIKTESGRWEVVISTPKSDDSIRFIPIPDCLNSLINAYRKSSGFVLEQENGKFVEPRLLQKKAFEIFSQTNVSIKNFHALRHTFATRLIDSGADPRTVSELLGHSTVQITMNSYVHPSFDMKKNAIDKICL